ncbi:MAG: tripartite tricarboxylate transporter TctB family protein [Methylobacterium sp.]|uniref:tripartite tricarboxylate transporter TctB family protein n=1 Tax=Methylobacterium sp. TaxID=409 RepID=UPI0025CFD84B|nr:tripartite tricarboxylate transporter TctB family protein [Methylobacterium sp.]MBX9931840.1 tripartite tricarboxylate transporter TctB family protein [Methylobacterium sp.]
MADASDTAPEAGLSRRIVEIIVALILMALSAMVLWDSYERGAGWDGGPQNGFFPARVGWILLIAAIAAFVSAIRREDSVFVTYGQLRLVGSVFAPLFLYVLAIEFLGIYAASALFMAVFMVMLGEFRWWQTLLAVIAVPVVCFWVFEIQFRLSLPKGPVEAMLGF